MDEIIFNKLVQLDGLSIEVLRTALDMNEKLAALAPEPTILEQTSDALRQTGLFMWGPPVLVAVFLIGLVWFLKKSKNKSDTDDV